MNTFHLDIITPARIVYNDNVEMVMAPTASGIIGVLPGHVPLFTRLTEGEVVIKIADKEILLAIGSGFMEISGTTASILVTSAYHSSELNEKEILEAKKRAEEALAQKPTGEALIEAESLFRRSMVELKVIHRRKHNSNISEIK
jgi:F-type H+-transporting ATPase subunit epsilon